MERVPQEGMIVSDRCQLRDQTLFEPSCLGGRKDRRRRAQLTWPQVVASSRLRSSYGHHRPAAQRRNASRCAGLQTVKASMMSKRPASHSIARSETVMRKRAETRSPWEAGPQVQRFSSAGLRGGRRGLLGDTRRFGRGWSFSNRRLGGASTSWVVGVCVDVPMQFLSVIIGRYGLASIAQSRSVPRRSEGSLARWSLLRNLACGVSRPGALGLSQGSFRDAG